METVKPQDAPAHLYYVGCPVCLVGGCPVRPTYSQATRYEPSKLLGHQGYCRACDVYFKVDSGASR